jgi:hypothetical protein
MRRALAAVLFSALPLAAQESPLFPRFGVTAGLFDARFRTDVRIAKSDFDEATDIAVERDLGLPGSKRVVNASVFWRPGARHELTVSHRQARREGFEQIDREIVFRGTSYPVNADVSTAFDTETWELAYTFWALRRERAGFGIVLGASTISFDAAVEAVAPGGTATITESAQTDVPVALGGIQARGAFTSRLFGEAVVTVLPRVEIDVYSGSAVNAVARLEYRIGGPVGVGLAWNDFRIDGTVEQTELAGDLDMEVRGTEAFVRIAF